MKCEHPYYEVDCVGRDGEYDDPGDHYFTICTVCHEILVGEYPGNLFSGMMVDSQVLGYVEIDKVVEHYGLPSLPEESFPVKDGGEAPSLLGDILKSFYAESVIEDLGKLSPPIMEKFRGKC